MRKTLGGDRIGSGKKMTVDMHEYGRSTHDLGYVFRTSQAAGTLVPFICEIGLPGDTFDIDLTGDTKTHPAVGPLFGSYKDQKDVFMVPIRLYNSLLHNNMLDIGYDISRVKFPLMKLKAYGADRAKKDIDNAQVNPSSILAYLGIRGVGMIEETIEEVEREFNAISLLAYWDIYKNYYANKQEEIGAVIHTPNETLIESVTQMEVTTTGGVEVIGELPISMQDGYQIRILWETNEPKLEQLKLLLGDGVTVLLNEVTTGAVVGDNQTIVYWIMQNYGSNVILDWSYVSPGDIEEVEPKVATFPLVNIDYMRRNILAWNSETTPFIVNTVSLAPYTWILGESNNVANMLSTQEGLAVKTYQSDLFNNWLNSERFDHTETGINAITAISTTGDKFTIDALRMGEKVNNMLNRVAVSGGSYNDYIDAVYTQKRKHQAETPVYMGGMMQELVFQEVVSNSQSEGQPLGTLAGRGTMAGKPKGGRIVIKCDEPCYIIGLTSLTPRIDYSQGNRWDTSLLTMDDLHKPALDGIGFQDSSDEQKAWWTTNWDSTNEVWVKQFTGKQPAWINYMTNVNRCFGNFAIENNEMFMTLNRRYEADRETYINEVFIKDNTTYIDPSKYNFIFAETRIDAQNFWTQIAVNITARRVLSAKVMPSL